MCRDSGGSGVDDKGGVELKRKVRCSGGGGGGDEEFFFAFLCL